MSARTRETMERRIPTFSPRAGVAGVGQYQGDYANHGEEDAHEIDEFVSHFQEDEGEYHHGGDCEAVQQLCVCACVCVYMCDV